MGPSIDRTTSLTASASDARVRSGLAAATTGWPAPSRGSMTPFQLDESAKAPWTRMIVGVMLVLSGELTGASVSQGCCTRIRQDASGTGQSLADVWYTEARTPVDYEAARA